MIHDFPHFTFDLNEAVIVLMLTTLQKWMERTKDDEDNQQDGPVGDCEHFHSICVYDVFPQNNYEDFLMSKYSS